MLCYFALEKRKTLGSKNVREKALGVAERRTGEKRVGHTTNKKRMRKK